MVDGPSLVYLDAIGMEKKLGTVSVIAEKTKTVNGSSLMRGLSMSCGCIRSEVLSDRRMLRLSGKKFTWLNAIKPIGQNDKRDYVWECKCKCGNLTYVTAENLSSGNTKSCGCLRGYIASISRLGDNHHNWNGGVTGELKKLRSAKGMRKWRENVLERDNYTCQVCGDSEQIMHVHHIKQFSEFVELRASIDNGLTLCEKCHIEIHRKNKSA